MCRLHPSKELSAALSKDPLSLSVYMGKSRNSMLKLTSESGISAKCEKSPFDSSYFLLCSSISPDFFKLPLFTRVLH